MVEQVDLIARWIAWFESTSLIGGETPTDVKGFSIALGAVLGMLLLPRSMAKSVDRYDRKHVGDLPVIQNLGWTIMCLLLVTMAMPTGILVGVLAASALTIVVWNHTLLFIACAMFALCFAKIAKVYAFEKYPSVSLGA